VGRLLSQRKKQNDYEKRSSIYTFIKISTFNLIIAQLRIKQEQWEKAAFCSICSGKFVASV
jgi:hypothetical protein